MRTALSRLEQLAEEKEVLSQELRHRVRNSLHVVYGLLNAEIDGEHTAHSISAFRSISLRVLGLAEVFDHLLGSGMTKRINFGEYVTSLCNTLPQLYGETQISLSCDAGRLLLDLDESTALGIVITELVNNAYLHAFPDGAGTIAVRLDPKGDHAVLTVEDDGVGFIERDTNRRGMGLIRRLVKQLGGTLDRRTDHGTKWALDFKTSMVH